MSKSNALACHIHLGETIKVETASPGYTQEKFDEIKATGNFPTRYSKDYNRRY